MACYSEFTKYDHGEKNLDVSLATLWWLLLGKVLSL